MASGQWSTNKHLAFYINSPKPEVKLLLKDFADVEPTGTITEALWKTCTGPGDDSSTKVTFISESDNILKAELMDNFIAWGMQVGHLVRSR